VKDYTGLMVEKAMSRSEFEKIKKYLHFADNENLDTADKIAKVRPLIDLVNKKIQKFRTFCCKLSDDEQMIPFFGRHSCKMFIRVIPIRFGYKAWILACSHGFPFHIQIYCEKLPSKLLARLVHEL
jgi:DNA excision repair protein ERCC-6